MRLTQPPDHQITHPETGTCRALFDCPDLLLAPTGPRTRVTIATHPTTATAAPIGTTRSGVVYELFFTALPQVAFTAADVVDLYLHQGAFETILSDEDQEQVTSRWCSHTACGQEAWQILSQWIWNLYLELGHALAPTPCAPPNSDPREALACCPARRRGPADVSYKPPEWAVARMGCIAVTQYTPQPDGTLRCPADSPLYPKARLPERDGSLRVLYAARD